MYILAVNISHHASVCLLKDGEMVFFLEEERVSKIKSTWRWCFLVTKVSELSSCI